MLYPQHGDGIVTIDSVTSLHPMHNSMILLYRNCYIYRLCFRPIYFMRMHSGLTAVRAYYANSVRKAQICLCLFVQF